MLMWRITYLDLVSEVDKKVVFNNNHNPDI